jgi:hypothetical protein
MVHTAPTTGTGTLSTAKEIPTFYFLKLKFSERAGKFPFQSKIFSWLYFILSVQIFGSGTLFA